MSRIPFSQVLKNAKIDYRREYDRLYSLFHATEIQGYTSDYTTLRGYCEACFLSFPFRRTCISLNDFDRENEFSFVQYPSSFTLDYLVSFCEYSYNLIYHIMQNSSESRTRELNCALYFYTKQVEAVIDIIGYMKNSQGGVIDFVPKDQAAISVAEIVEPELSYKVIEYNHHSMKGDLERKQATLLVLAGRLEAQRSKLKQINASLESDIFLIFNNVNVRHNNTEPGGQYFISFVAGMKSEEIEHWYDELYQMCLLAFLELDHLSRKKSVEQFRKNLQTQ